MTTRKSESGNKPKVEKLELNRETVQDLTDSEAEAAQGGRPRHAKQGNTNGCSAEPECNAPSKRPCSMMSCNRDCPSGPVICQGRPKAF
jgi:hypothetical protein